MNEYVSPTGPLIPTTDEERAKSERRNLLAEIAKQSGQSVDEVATFVADMMAVMAKGGDKS
jgi:hypothetical protein